MFAGPLISRRKSFTLLIPLFVAGTGALQASPAGASAQPGTLTIVAHEDDDLIFISPDLLHAIQAGAAVRTVYVTAGDDGMPASYWMTRENGPKAAYALMAASPNTWTESDAGVPGHPMPMFTLSGHPNITLVHMRLPDGNLNGSGFPSTGNESLQQLWQGTIATIDAVDGSSSYTQASLIDTLASLMTAFQPAQIYTQDFVGTFGDGDHSDHHATAYLAQAAAQRYATAHGLSGYEGYGTSSRSANVSGADLTMKQNAFYAYAQDDSQVCYSPSSCAGSNYATWLLRQYTVSAAGPQPPVADAGPDQAVGTGVVVTLDGSGSFDPDGDPLTYQWSQTGGTAVTLSGATVVQPTFTAPGSAATLTFQLVVSDGTTSSSPADVTVTVSAAAADLALSATATASSQNTSTGQTAAKAIDGVIDGYPGDHTREWATNGGGAGSWLKLAWSSAQTFNTIVLYDRPNLSDQITGGNIKFSDGSSVTVPSLNNDGSATTLSFAAKTVTSLKLTITAVSATTQNVGLAEIQVYDMGAGPQPPVADAGPDQAVGTGVVVTLDGSGSFDPDGDPLTYQWSQTGGTAVTLSGATVVQPTFTAPGSAATLTFQLVVSDGTTSSSPADVTVTVSAAAADLALSATATASSQNTSTGQTAAKAIDGVIDGYPGDHTREWATNGGGAGSWLKLAWSSAQTFNTIVLYDRPNLSDQITGGNIKFSDGSSVTVPSLNNDGSATTLSFAAKTVTSLKLTITAVSATTQNVGLAEIQVYKR